MTRTVSIVTFAIAAVTLAAGGYFYMSTTRTETVTIQPPPSTSLPADTTPAPRPKPEHGDFEKRFVPKPPPTNGGKLN
ncbi:MAG: hypothetical protein JSR59_21675 [Proteobacteria bacterium]|nr:hypothetical protein [Pseudomonadota bacterium]